MDGLREQRSDSSNDQRDNLLNSLHECDTYKELSKKRKDPEDITSFQQIEVPVHMTNDQFYQTDWLISNREIVKIDGEYIHLPPNHWNPYVSRVMRRNGKTYCNGKVWNKKKHKWRFSIKAYWYYIFDRRT